MRRWPLLVLLLLPVACSDDEQEPLAAADPPASYQILYRVHEGDAVTSERLTVERPFRSRIETFASRDGRGEATSVEITDFGRSSRVAGDAQPLTVAIPPSVAPGDARLEHALGTDELELHGSKTIAGRPCDVYRTGQSLRLLEVLPESQGSRVELCVDAAGLVLEEITDDRRRVAVDVDTDPTLDDDAFDVGERTIPVLDGGGALQELTLDSRTPDTFWELGDDLPLKHTGRYAVVPPQPDAFGDLRQRGQRVATTTDVLSDGLDVVMIDRGGSLGSVDVVHEDERGKAVDLGDLGDGVLLRTSFGGEITVELGEGRFVRISGTVPDDELVAIARGLHEVDGGKLTPIGEAW